MAQEIYLSPRKILNHLKDIERKIPKSAYTIYLPSHARPGVSPNERLLTEARRMAEYAGLRGYHIDVKFAELDKNTGGNILQGNEYDKTLHINVSKEYQGNDKATLAILAHEICHKVLQVHDLETSIELMNEVYTDLTTIYMGFGEIIISGYNTTIVDHSNQIQKNNILGYLTPDTYKVTHEMILSIFGIKGVHQVYTDPYAEDTIKRWENNDDKEQLLKTCFIEKEGQMALLNRNILILEEILNQCKKNMSYEFDKADEAFYKVPYGNNAQIKFPIAAFSAVYELNFRSDDAHLSKLTEAIDRAIFNIYTTLQESATYEFKYDFSCPFCGTKGKNNKIVDKVAVIKCPQCKRHYTFDARIWNASAHQGAIDQEQREKKRKEREESDAHKLRIDNETAQKILAIKTQSAKEISDIRTNEQERTKRNIIQQMPPWLRWFAKRYVK